MHRIAGAKICSDLECAQLPCRARIFRRAVSWRNKNDGGKHVVAPSLMPTIRFVGIGDQKLVNFWDACHIHLLLMSCFDIFVFMFVHLCSLQKTNSTMLVVHSGVFSGWIHHRSGRQICWASSFSRVENATSLIGQAAPVGQCRATG